MNLHDFQKTTADSGSGLKSNENLYFIFIFLYF